MFLPSRRRNTNGGAGCARCLEHHRVFVRRSASPFCHCLCLIRLVWLPLLLACCGTVTTGHLLRYPWHGASSLTITRTVSAFAAAWLLRGFFTFCCALRFALPRALRCIMLRAAARLQHLPAAFICHPHCRQTMGSGGETAVRRAGAGSSCSPRCHATQHLRGCHTPPPRRARVSCAAPARRQRRPLRY